MPEYAAGLVRPTSRTNFKCAAILAAHSQTAAAAAGIMADFQADARLNIHEDRKGNFKPQKYHDRALQDCRYWLEPCGVTEASERYASLLGHYQSPGSPPTALR